MNLEDKVGVALTCCITMDSIKELLVIMNYGGNIKNVGDKNYYKRMYNEDKSRFIKLLKDIPEEDLTKELEKECYDLYRDKMIKTYNSLVLEQN
jgi:hypothetical protein